MKTKYNYNKLKGRIKEYCGTNDIFSEKLGISNTSLYKKLSNQVYFTQDEIRKAVEALNIKEEEIYDIFFTKEV